MSETDGHDPLKGARLVGPEMVDPLSGEGGLLEAFQDRGHFSDLSPRAGGFIEFIRAALSILREYPGIKQFGLRVVSNVKVDRGPTENGTDRIIVRPKVELKIVGEPRPLIDSMQFYATYLPFNAIFEGSFAVCRADQRVQRYFEALDRIQAAGGYLDPKETEVRRSILALLAAEAEEGFTRPSLEIEVPSRG